jgi:hypothetical protein
MLVVFKNMCLSLKLKIPIMKIIFKNYIDFSILQITVRIRFLIIEFKKLEFENWYFILRYFVGIPFQLFESETKIFESKI